jgi:hypothetical protein
VPKFTVELSEEEVRYLEQLCVGQWAVAPDVAGIIEHFARHAADGVRRPGAWERDWVSQCTGWPYA